MKVLHDDKINFKDWCHLPEGVADVDCGDGWMGGCRVGGRGGGRWPEERGAAR